MEKHQYLSIEPPNDFAYWVSEILGEKMLGEKLDGIDTLQFRTIHDLRGALIETIETYIADYPRSKKRFADDDSLFHFIKSISFILPTPYRAEDLETFLKMLKQVSTSSIYFHMFEARLRLEREKNDFSYWLESALLNKELGDKKIGRASCRERVYCEV